jgi:hypothetical protein
MIYRIVLEMENNEKNSVQLHFDEKQTRLTT